MIGTVTGREITTNKDGSVNRLLLQVEVTGPEDVRTVELYTSSGENSNPPNGSKVVILDVGRAFEVAIAVDDGIEPDVNPGERKIYSSSEGTIQAFLTLLASGVIQINGDADFALRYGPMKEAFDQLVSDHNSHIHTTTATVGTGGPPGTISPPTAASSADMSGAKVDEVTLP